MTTEGEAKSVFGPDSRVLYLNLLISLPIASVAAVRFSPFSDIYRREMRVCGYIATYRTESTYQLNQLDCKINCQYYQVSGTH